MMGKRRRRMSLGKDKDYRKALFRNLISALILHGRIKTTRTKAKAIRGLADKIVNQAKTGSLRHRDQLANFLTGNATVTRLYDHIVPRFKHRQSGFTRIVELGRRRGDDATIVMLEWVERKDKQQKQSI